MTQIISSGGKFTIQTCYTTILSCSARDMVSVASPSVSHSNPSTVSLTTCAPDSLCSLTSASFQSDTLSEILSLPKPKQRKQKRWGMNTTAVVIYSGQNVLKELEEKVEQKKIREEENERKKIKREQKQKAREEKRLYNNRRKKRERKEKA